MHKGAGAFFCVCDGGGLWKDVMTMPHMTGDRLSSEALKIRPDIPIILCTGYSEKISQERAEELGIRKYIEEPLTKEILANSVRKVLDG